MVRQELKATNQTMTEVEIKKWAIYLSKWSEPDFYQKSIEEFKSLEIEGLSVVEIKVIKNKTEIVYEIC